MKNIYDIALDAAQETRKIILDEMRTNALWTINDYLQGAWWRTKSEVRTAIYTLAIANVITGNDMNALINLIDSVENWEDKDPFPNINPYTEEGQANMTRLLEEWKNRKAALIV